MKMKRSLIVRASAVVLVLAIAFCLKLPDFVSAEGEQQNTEQASAPSGDSQQETQPDVTVPEETPSQEEVQQPEQTPSGGNDQSDVSTPEETPSQNDGQQEAPSQDDGKQETQPDATVPEETPSQEEVQQPADTAAGTDAVQPSDSTQTADASNGTKGQTATEPETQEAAPGLLEPEWDVETKTVAAAAQTASTDTTIDLEASENTGEFVVEGNTITGYSGAGGHIAIPEGVT